MSVGQSQPTPCSVGETLRRCKNNGVKDNVIFIDIDTEDFDNVILNDVPESLSKKLRGSNARKDKRYPGRTVICIDDDESIDNDHPNIGVKENENFCNGASSSMRSCHAADECQFDQENISPVKVSKCKQTYSGKAHARNRYGLDPESESDSSDDDLPDCELVEDSSGELQKQWNKASLKRKFDNCRSDSDFGGCTNTSKISPDAWWNVGVENIPEQHNDVPVHSSPDKVNCEKEDSSTATVNLPRDITWDSEKARFAEYVLKTVLGIRIRLNKPDVDHRYDPSTKESDMNYGETIHHQYPEHGGPISQNSGQGFKESSFPPKREQAAEQIDHLRKAFQGTVRTPPTEPCMSNYDSCDKVFHNGKASSAERPCPGTRRFKEQEELLNAEPSSMNTNLHNEQIDHDVYPSSDKVGPVPEQSFSCRSPFYNSEMNADENHHRENGKFIYKEFMSQSSHINEAQCGREKSCSPEAEEDLAGSVSNCEHENEEDTHAQDGGILHGTKNCLINDREKLKETDDYKRAREEEWASRQQAIQIQAEEAKQQRRLLKRRKAECTRILDMKTRQKQRLEEMRESQKKDEERTNLKELIRSEVRKELSKLEISCHNMASLLCSLGIQVGIELKPSPDEVRAACKRALFVFHPDRASKSNVREQVEAEEKFKLISRMKDKLLPTQ